MRFAPLTWSGHLLSWFLVLVAFLVPQLSAAPSKPPVKAKNQPLPAGFHRSELLDRFLKGPMAGLDEIVFAVRVAGRDHWYVNFGNYSDEYNKDRAFKFEDGVYWGYGEGGRLCRLNLRTGELKVLLDDPQGGVRDPQVHYDGRKILFSYRKGGEHPYHLYEIHTDGSGLKQLTDGPDDDIEPVYCPDGSIVFCSSRCRRFVNCWYSRVATLYRCDGDGGNIRMLSSNNDHDNTPWLLPDGRVLYMRWEYVDRSQVHYHHLWTTNPDGTGQMVFFGNEVGGVAMLDAKPIPGSNKIVASFSPGHGRHEHEGPVTILDPALGPDVMGAPRRIGDRSDWRDPYALSEDCFLVANKLGLYVMDGAGQAEPLYVLPEGDRHMQCHEPRPLSVRPRETIIPARVHPDKATARLVLQDVYAGRNMAGVKRGEIKKLLVMQQLPKPVNFSGGMEPLTIGGSFTLAQVLGTVPVEEDGSAYMELPALRSLFFVALDENDMSVKRMQSFVVLQPGETFSCVGCHEQRNQAPHYKPDLTALQRPPRTLEPVPGVPDVLDFSRDVQPILDRHCVACHSPDKYEGRVDLTGDRTARYTVSYWTIRQRNLVVDGRNEPRGNRDPRSIGSSPSRLMKLIDGSHYGTKLSDLEKTTVRLWIEAGATYPGTYAALGCGNYGVHIFSKALRERCGECHGREVNDKYGKRFVVSFPNGNGASDRPEPCCNLSRPDKSHVLLAPLAKHAGGLQLCKKVVFADTNDPLYQSLLKSIQDSHQRLVEGKRFDMPGFRPNGHYIREMQRFGFLPKDLAADQPVDFRAVDRAYWDSFNYRPQAGTTVDLGGP